MISCSFLTSSLFSSFSFIVAGTGTVVTSPRPPQEEQVALEDKVHQLAGKVKKGLFRALAYKNMTNSVSGKGQVILHMLLGIIFTIVGIATIPMGIGLIFAPAGMYSIWHSRQLSNAYNLVTSTL